MKQQIILPGQGKSYDWSKDHVVVKSALDLSDGRLTLVEDRLKPGFFLAPTVAQSSLAAKRRRWS